MCKYLDTEEYEQTEVDLLFLSANAWNFIIKLRVCAKKQLTLHINHSTSIRL